jgi:hypothetical protein
MNKHTNEEHRIEIWDGGCPAYDKAPRKGLDPIGRVVLVNTSISDAKGVWVGGVSELTGFRAYAHHPDVNNRLLLVNRGRLGWACDADY